MSSSDEPIRPMSEAPVRRVLLVGWEGADWRVIQPLVDAGEMPQISAMIERGVMGNVSSLIPMVCPLLWTSVATGVFADRHDILTAIEPDGRGGARATRSTSRRRKALWNILSQNGLRSAVIGWPVTHPAEPIDGVVVSNRFFRATPPADVALDVDDHSMHPPELRDEIMQLHVSSSEIGRGQIASFVPRVDEIDLAADPRPASIAALLAQAASVQQVATWAAQRTTWDFMAVYYGMTGGLNRGFSQYHPPRDDSMDEHDAELYGEVITTGYKFQDMMLGRLIELVGSETLVMLVSDHGFGSQRRSLAGGQSRGDIERARPYDDVIDPHAPYRNHRRDAFYCMAGPGLRRDELAFGMRLVDVAPTILASLALPVPRDMDGGVITKVFETSPVQRWTESYEARAENDGIHDRELSEDIWVSNEIVENLSALGLVRLELEAAAALELCTQQRRLNLAQSLASQARFAEAAAAYRTALEWEDSLSVRLPYVECLLMLGRLDEAQKEAAAIAAAIPDSAVAHLLAARMAIERGDPTVAASRLDELQDIDGSSVGVSLQLGWLALRLGRFQQGLSLFVKLLEDDPESARAHEGLGVALLRLDRIEESVFHHTQSVRLSYHRSAAHEHLGESLVAGGQLDWAERAFEIALELNPSNDRAAGWLRRVELLRQIPRESGSP